MGKLSLLLKLVSSYLLTGFLSLGFLGVYVILTKGNLASSDLPFFSNLFLWPVSSFSSAQQILGEDQAGIWNWFNFSTILLFLCLVTFLTKKARLSSTENDLNG